MAIQEVSFKEALEEIRDLQNDPHVLLAMQEQKIKKVIDANLRSLMKLKMRGMELEMQGVTLKMLRGEDDAENVFSAP